MEREIKTNITTIALAHQLKSVLAAIKWPLQMLMEGDYGKVTPAQKDIIEKMLLKNNGFIMLVNDLLSAEKNTDGEYYYNQSSESLGDIINSVIDFYKEQAHSKKIAIAFIKESKDIPNITVDKEMMRLAIQNIIDNAIKYTPIHGQVTIFLSADKQNVRCRVQDCGIGVEEKSKDKLFTKFFRGANAVRVDPNGSGLGLFIAKNIIQDHGGKIVFTSQEHRGTTFTITLPINH